MKKSLILCTLLAVFGLQNFAHAEFEFIYIIKEREYRQVGNVAPTIPVGWVFGAGVDGDSQVTGATLTHPGSVTPVNLPGEDGSYEIDIQDIANQSLLDTDYPNGNYSLSITDNGSTQSYPFTITGDSYPVIPHLLYPMALHSHDLKQPFTLKWGPFTGADASDTALVQIWDSNADNEVLFRFVDTSATSIVIPGGSFSPNGFYEIGITFVNETSELQNVDTIVGYTSSNYFDIDLSPQFFEDPSVLVSKGISTNQTSAAAPTPSNYGFLVEADGVEFSSVTAIKPDTSEVPVPADGFGEFDLEGDFVSEAARDEAYPEGNYSVRVVENGQEIVLGPFPQTGGTLPDIPYITNWDAAQSIDPNQDFVLDWNAFSNAGPNAMIEVEIWNINDQNNPTDFILAGAETGAILSADFLQPSSTYQGEIIFINPTVAPSTSNGIMIDSFYESFTQFSFQTGDGEGGGGGGGGDPTGVDFIYTIKERAYDQVGNIVGSEPAEWNFGAGVVGGDLITAATITYPGSGGPVDLNQGDGDFGLDDQDFPTQEALDAAVPNGQVSLHVTVDGINQDLGPFSITGNEYPPVPNMLNAAAIPSADFSQDFTLMWNAFTTSDPNDQIRIELERTDDGERLIEDFYDASTTSLVIPGDTLEMNRNYELLIIFINETDGLETPDTIIGYISNTRFNFSTYPNYKASNDLEIWLSKGTLGMQNSDQDPGVQDWFFFADSGITGITSMSINLPNGTDLDIPISTVEPDLFEYEERFASQAELDTAFPDGNYHITVTVNGVQTTYGPYSLAGGGPPNQPYFTNYSAFQSVDPSSPFSIEWAPFSNPPQDASLELEIQSAPGYGDLDLDFDSSDPSITSVEIPANSLEPNSKYIVSGFFLAPSTTGTDPEVFLGYETLVQTTFWTGSPMVGPNPATDLTAIIGSQTNVHLDWIDNSSDETGFRIERRFIWEGDWTSLGNTAANATTYTDTSGALGEAYTYRVIAFDGSDDGSRSNEVEVQMQPPAEPTDLSVDPYNSTTLTLSWSDNSEGESGFGIDRSTDGASWSNVGNTGPDENVFIDTGLDSGSTFTYRVTALSALGSSDTSDAGSDTTYEATTGKPINISTRGTIGSGDDFIMIAGFVITGNENKDIYIRGIAPSLPITGETALLQDPELILFDGAKNQIDFNDNWKDHPRMADTIATFIPPPLDQESAIYTNLAPGVYTVQMRGADGGIGAGLVEVYEANPGDDAQLVNISTRGIAGTGDGLMIAGVIVKGTGNRTLYIRGNGPSLPASLGGRLTDTTLVMRDASENIVAESDNWMDNDNFASIVATTIPPGFPEEAAILVNVPASASGEKYTIELRGAGGEEGLAIIEIFEVPE
ncbi:fibronectin type III domain-containing protein [bacterium]|nr:fibronectin type III domain-containing protein [bacterium]